MKIDKYDMCTALLRSLPKDEEVYGGEFIYYLTGENVRNYDVFKRKDTEEVSVGLCPLRMSLCYKTCKGEESDHLSEVLKRVPENMRNKVLFHFIRLGTGVYEE